MRKGSLLHEWLHNQLLIIVEFLFKFQNTERDIDIHIENVPKS